MTDTKTLAERLREEAASDEQINDLRLALDRFGDGLTIAITPRRLRQYLVRLDVAEAALDSQAALLREALEVVKGVIAVADRKTVEFDRAHAFLAKAGTP